jgi:hypothetical protein
MTHAQTQVGSQKAAAKTIPAHPNATRANAVAAEVKAKADAKAEATKTPAESKKAKEPKAPKVEAVDTRIVKLLVDKNPKREGTASHARFACYVAGQTADQYKDAVVKLGQARRHATADLAWDLKHGFISLT